MSTLAEQAFQLFQAMVSGFHDRDTSGDTHGHLVEVIHRTEQAGAPQSRKREFRRCATQASFPSRPEAADNEGGGSRGVGAHTRAAVSAALLAGERGVDRSAHGAHAAMSAQASRSGEHETSSSWFPRRGRPHVECVCRRIRSGAPGGIRTPDPRLRRPMLYPTELQARQALTIHQTIADVHRASYGLVPPRAARQLGAPRRRAGGARGGCSVAPSPACASRRVAGRSGGPPRREANVCRLQCHV